MRRVSEPPRQGSKGDPVPSIATRRFARMVEAEYGRELAAGALAAAAELVIRTNPEAIRVPWSDYFGVLRSRGVASIAGRTLDEIERGGGQPPRITQTISERPNWVPGWQWDALELGLGRGRSLGHAAYADTLLVGSTYAWDELAAGFGFDVGYLNRAGGMPTLPAHDTVMAITHPGGGKSFDYDDRWEDSELIYTGRGQVGNQKLEGANRDLADNRRRILGFEAVGSAALRFLGTARCIEFWPDSGLDREGRRRRIYRFRLRFGERDRDDGPTKARRRRSRGARSTTATETSPERRSRRFDPARRPTKSAVGRIGGTPEEVAARREKATQGHHDALVALARLLGHAAWSDPEEIPAAIDLWSRPSAGGLPRVIFEVKTVKAGAELARVRAGLAQLLEYRLLYGESDDELCLVATQPISDQRVRLLRALGIDVAWLEDDALRTVGVPFSAAVASIVT